MKLMKSVTLKTIIPLFIVLIIDAMGFGLAFPIIGPLLMDPHVKLLSINASLTERGFFYGIINASAFIALLFGAPYFGDLSDKFGRKKTIITCLLLISFGYLICVTAIFIHSISLFILGRIIDGFSAGSESIAQAAIIDISPPEKKTINLGVISVAGSLGFIIGPLVGGIFSDATISPWFGYITPFIIAGGLALLNAGCLVFTLSETHYVRESKINFFKGLTIFKSAFTEKKLRNLSWVFLLAQMSWAIYFQLVSLVFAEKFHYLPKQIGFFYAYLGLIIALTMTFLIRFFLTRMEEKQLILFSLILAMLGFSLNVIVQTAWMPWISILFIGIGMGMFYACILSLYSTTVAENQQGWVMGVANAVVAVAWGLGGLAVSLINIQHNRILLGFGLFLTLVALLLYRRKFLI
jgi:MFS transporter, DHA1 family, tetracycline resistance protein